MSYYPKYVSVAKREKIERLGLRREIPAVIVRFGREICSETPDGDAEYRARVLRMLTRQWNLCCICELFCSEEEATFEHGDLRGMGPARFEQRNVLTVTADEVRRFDFGWASSPCEEFSVHCMKHFHPNPKWPEMGIRLFEHTRNIFEQSGIKYVMENVRCAEKFVGKAVNHCGPFYLWGNAVPAIMRPEFYKFVKGVDMKGGKVQKAMSIEERRIHRKQSLFLSSSSHSALRRELTAKAAEIPRALSEYIASTVNQF